MIWIDLTSTWENVTLELGPQLSDLVNYIFLPPLISGRSPVSPWRLEIHSATGTTRESMKTSLWPGSRRDVSRPARRLGIVDVCNLWHDVSIGDWGSYLLHIFPCAFQLCEMRHTFLPRSFCPLQLSLPWLRDHQSNKAWLDFSGVSSGFPEISECENSYFNDPWTRFCLKISENPIKKTHKILDLYTFGKSSGSMACSHWLAARDHGTTGRRPSLEF